MSQYSLYTNVSIKHVVDVITNASRILLNVFLSLSFYYWALNLAHSGICDTKSYCVAEILSYLTFYWFTFYTHWNGLFIILTLPSSPSSSFHSPFISLLYCIRISWRHHLMERKIIDGFFALNVNNGHWSAEYQFRFLSPFSTFKVLCI